MLSSPLISHTDGCIEGNEEPSVAGRIEYASPYPPHPTPHTPCVAEKLNNINHHHDTSSFFSILLISRPSKLSIYYGVKWAAK